jgi:hypothetical protein
LAAAQASIAEPTPAELAIIARDSARVQEIVALARGGISN